MSAHSVETTSATGMEFMGVSSREWHLVVPGRFALTLHTCHSDPEFFSPGERLWTIPPSTDSCGKPRSRRPSWLAGVIERAAGQRTLLGRPKECHGVLALNMNRAQETPRSVVPGLTAGAMPARQRSDMFWARPAMMGTIPSSMKAGR